MLKKDTKILSSEGREFNCYIVTPEKEQKVSAVVLASAIHGVDKDLRGIADEFASHGYIAAAPDLFWRTVPGPLVRDDPRSAPRGQPRLEKIKTGERDLAGVHHLGRPGSCGARQCAGRLSRRACANEERGSACVPRRAAWLHDARQPEGFRREDVRLFHETRARHLGRPAPIRSPHCQHGAKRTESAVTRISRESCARSPHRGRARWLVRGFLLQAWKESGRRDCARCGC